MRYVTPSNNELQALSVVIPAYNAGQWIERTLTTLETALELAEITDYEVIVVNDGSTDDTSAVVEAAAGRNPRIVKIDQDNRGRLLARMAGLEVARHDATLLLDARIDVFPKSFVALNSYLERGVTNRVWNGHVNIRYGWNLFARFWGVVTFIGWADYLRRPRFVEFGVKDFDRYPKGTGFLLAPTAALLDSSTAYRSLTDDPRFVSDDTGVLRALASNFGIAIAPEFGCWYEYGRSSLSAFVRHSTDRGTMFVDSYLRPGTRFFVPLLGFLAGSIVCLVAALIWPTALAFVLGGGWFAVVILALALRAGLTNVAAFALVSPVFAVAFGLGIWRGSYQAIRALVRRRARS